MMWASKQCENNAVADLGFFKEGWLGKYFSQFLKPGFFLISLFLQLRKLKQKEFNLVKRADLII